MLEELGGVTSKLIDLSLDASSLRHKLIANNIANYDTPGYQVRRLIFEDHFKGLIGDIASVNDSVSRSRIDVAKAYLNDGNSMVVSENRTVELDQEMISLTENTLRYQAILKAAGKRMDLLSMAINGGRK